jgi:hypothetical protein
MVGAPPTWSAGTIAYSASMNSYPSRTDAPSRSTLLFFLNSSSISSSRLGRSSSRSRARSNTCSNGSSSARFSRQARTQFPSDVSLIPSYRATSAIGREVSTTRRAASSLNSGEYVLYFPAIIPSFPVENPKGSAVRKLGARQRARRLRQRRLRAPSRIRLRSPCGAFLRECGVGPCRTGVVPDGLPEKRIHVWTRPPAST